MADEAVELDEAPRIEELLDPLAGEQLAARALPLDSLLVAGVQRFVAQARARRACRVPFSPPSPRRYSRSESRPMPTSLPAGFLRVENLSVVVAAVALYFDADYSAWAFFAFLLAPTSRSPATSEARASAQSSTTWRTPTRGPSRSRPPACSPGSGAPRADRTHLGSPHRRRPRPRLRPQVPDGLQGHGSRAHLALLVEGGARARARRRRERGQAGRARRSRARTAARAGGEARAARAPGARASPRQELAAALRQGIREHERTLFGSPDRRFVPPASVVERQ